MVAVGKRVDRNRLSKSLRRTNVEILDRCFGSSLTSTAIAKNRGPGTVGSILIGI